MVEEDDLRKERAATALAAANERRLLARQCEDNDKGEHAEGGEWPDERPPREENERRRGAREPWEGR